MASSRRPSPQSQVYIPIESPIFSQLADSAEVTLKRTNNTRETIQVVVSTEPPQGASPPVAVPSLGSVTPYTPGIPTQALSLPVAAAGRHYAPIREVVTFARGEEVKTVAIPLIPGQAGSGERVLPIYVTPASPGVSGSSAMLRLVDRADVTSPSVVGARLVGRRGIELAFSEPMDPASVEKPARYAVSENDHRPNGLDLARFVLTGTVASHTARVKIISATYDTATRTVMLTSARPLKTSAEYVVMNARPRGSGMGRAVPLEVVAKLTDTSGNPISGVGPEIGGFYASINGANRGASRPRGPKAGRS